MPLVQQQIVEIGSQLLSSNQNDIFRRQLPYAHMYSKGHFSFLSAHKTGAAADCYLHPFVYHFGWRKKGKIQLLQSIEHIKPNHVLYIFNLANILSFPAVILKVNRIFYSRVWQRISHPSDPGSAVSCYHINNIINIDEIISIPFQI